MKKNLFVIFYYPFYLTKFIYRLFFNHTELRILIFHNIEKKQFAKFINLIKYLQKSWTILDPKDFLEIINKEKKPFGRYIMITFDDGFKSNYSIAEILQNEFKIKALFFIITNFLKIKKNEDSNYFARKNIKNFENNLSNLNIKDVFNIIKNGHLIGSHTCDHKILSDISEIELKDQLINSKKYLEDNFQIICNNFAVPYGNITSFDKKSVIEMKKNYDIIHTGIRGNNKNYLQNLFLKRDNINLDYSIIYNSLCVEGFFDLYYYISGKRAKKLFKKNVK